MGEKNVCSIVVELLLEIHENERKYLDALQNNEDDETLRSLRLYILNLRSRLEEVENSIPGKTFNGILL